MFSSDIILGIDLGTTNSVIAAVVNGSAFVIPNQNGQLLTPSVVSISTNGRFLVGEEARRQAVFHPHATVHSVKRLLGRRVSELATDQSVRTYAVDASKEGFTAIHAQDKHYTPQEISAVILMRLREMAEAHLQRPVRKAVLTVPAYFNESQRQASRDAGQIAGLEIVRLVSEPTAAALCYGFERRRAETVAVVHFGGGSFDVSIVELTFDGPMFARVVSTCGDTQLGGDDFDAALTRLLIEEFQEAHNVQLPAYPQSLERLRLACEQAKRELTTAPEVAVSLPYLYRDYGIQRVVKRAEFESLISPQLVLLS